MHALQDIGERLVCLGAVQLGTLNLPERLRDAILDAQRIKGFEARRRQLQYIGKLMRAVDPAPIRSQLDAWARPSRQATAWLHTLENWRDRLLADEQALTAFVQTYPDANLERLTALVQSVRQEQAAGLPPKSYRTLFKMLKDAIPATTADTVAPS